MATLEFSPVEICYLKRGSVEETEDVHQATNLAAAFQLVQKHFPEAVHVRCCEPEPDGGCVFVYATSTALKLDEADAAEHNPLGRMPDDYGRWIAIISSATRNEPTCERPSCHGTECE